MTPMLPATPKPIEVLYAPPAYLYEVTAPLTGNDHEITGRTPVVRYSDHCATVLALKQELEISHQCMERSTRRMVELLDTIRTLKGETK